MTKASNPNLQTLVLAGSKPHLASIAPSTSRILQLCNGQNAYDSIACQLDVTFQQAKTNPYPVESSALNLSRSAVHCFVAEFWSRWTIFIVMRYADRGRVGL
jgi:hypothetical protein